MARAAFAAEPRRMSIVRSMAAVASPRQFRFEIPGAMALLTLEIGMSAQQRKVRFASMIESRGLPAACVVTVPASDTSRPSVHIIDRMARDALFGRARKLVAGMTGGAGCSRM